MLEEISKNLIKERINSPFREEARSPLSSRRDETGATP